MSILAEYIQEFGRFQRNARLYLISNVLDGVTLGIILVLYNLYLVSLGYAADFIGLVLFVGTVGTGVAIFPAGACVDRFGGKAILIWSSLLIAVAGAGQMLFRQPLPLLVSAFVAGIGAAFVLVVNAPFLTANSTPAERSLLFSLNIVLTLVTTVLGELLGGALPIWLRMLPWLMAPLPPWLAWILSSQPLARSYQLAMLVAGLIAAPSMVPLFLLSDDRPIQGRDRFIVSAKPDPQGYIDGHTDTINRSLQHADTIKRSLRMPIPTYDQLKKILFSSMCALVVVYALTGLGAGLFIPYFNIYFVQHLRASSALFGAIDGGANALNAILTLAAPWLAMRLGKVNTIALTRLVSIPLLLIIGLTSLLPLVATVYLFRQGLMDMSAGILQVYSMEVVSKQRRGLANSSYQAAYWVAWALAAPLGGLIIVRIGYPPVFIIGALLYLLAIATLWSRFRSDGQERNAASNKEGSETSSQIPTNIIP